MSQDPVTAEFIFLCFSFSFHTPETGLGLAQLVRLLPQSNHLHPRGIVSLYKPREGVGGPPCGYVGGRADVEKRWGRWQFLGWAGIS